MESTKQPSEATVSGILTTFGAMVGLAFGPSAIVVLSFGPFIPAIEQDFGWSRVEVSFAVTIVSWMIVLVSPLQGILVDRFGPRRVVLASIPLFALGIGAFYFLPPDLLVYYSLWALIPVLGIGLWPLGYLQAVTRWFDRKLGFALGCANAGIGVGSTLVPLITGALIAAYSWREAFLGLALLIALVSWPTVFFCVREPAKTGEGVKRPAESKAASMPLAEAVREPSFMILCAAFFMLGLTATGLVLQQVPLLVDAGWTAADATFHVQFVFGFALLFARVCVGFVIDHIFAPRVMMTVSIGGAVACLLYAFFPNAATVSAILLGFLLGAEFDVLAFLIRRYYGNAAYGRLYGIIFSVFYVGSGLGILGLAQSRQTFGDYDTGLYIAAGILVTSAVLLTFLPRYRFGAGADRAVAPPGQPQVAGARR
jgi:MFS family permease